MVDPATLWRQREMTFAERRQDLLSAPVFDGYNASLIDNVIAGVYETYGLEPMVVNEFKVRKAILSNIQSSNCKEKYKNKYRGLLKY